MEQMPKVCICIPNYNNANTITQTLDSLLNQSYENIIIKVFDNTSTDDSLKILELYEKKYKNIELIQNEINIGAEGNFTKCIEGLEGEFGAIFHSDDIYHPTIVEKQVKCLMENDISAVFTRASLIDGNSKEIGEAFFPKELKNKTYLQLNFKELFKLILKYDNFLITPSCMARTKLYKENIVKWDESVYKTSSDLDVWLRFSQIKDIAILSEKLMSYRVATSSFSFRTKFSRITSRDMFLVIDDYLKKDQYSKDTLQDYNFLKFKDNLLIVNNKILNDMKVSSKDIKLIGPKLFIKVIYSRRNVTIVVFSIILKVLLLFKMQSLAKYLIQRIIKGTAYVNA